MLKIAIDAMGGDNGSSIVVSATKKFLADNSDVEVAVVGKLEELKELENLPRCRLVDGPDIIPMEAGPMEILRMKKASMNVAIRLVKEEGYDGVISCGSTGGFLSSSTIQLRQIPGVKRAALVTSFPTQVKGKWVTMCDVGANNENSPEELAQFALLGSLYSKAVFNTVDPKIYLICNGSEEGKGCPEVKGAYKLLKDKNFPGFMGNLEARYALSGDADVLVTDGFTGNVMLKTIEGVAKMLGGMMGDMFKKNLWTKLGYLHVRGGVKEFKDTMDYKKVGGALLLGINGVCVKAHGNSNAYSFYNALNLVLKLVKANVVESIRKGVLDA